MKDKFLNSIWLASSVKEWVIRSFGFGNFAAIGMLFLDYSRNGMTQPVISTFLMAILLINLVNIIFIGNLYRKYLKNELTKKEDLFKKSDKLL